jgi:hypothetical protein
MSSARAGRRGVALVALVAASALLAPREAMATPCADSVASYAAGTNGGFQSDLLPGIATGPPFGGGQFQGALDVVSLGDNGSITLSFDDNRIVDGPGVDFRVFENPFVNTANGPVFVEAGIVSASSDGVNFVPFPYDASTFAGLAGVTPVYSTPTNGIDPRTPQAGGDGFDLATIGLASARFVRIQDPGATVADPGNVFPVPGPGKSGFDLDAIVAVNSQEICAGCCDVNGDGKRQINDAVLLLREVLGVDTGTATCGPSPCSTETCGDANRSEALDIGDAVLCLRTILDQVSRCTKGSCDLDP